MTDDQYRACHDLADRGWSALRIAWLLHLDHDAVKRTVATGAQRTAALAHALSGRAAADKHRRWFDRWQREQWAKAAPATSRPGTRTAHRSAPQATAMR